MAKKKKSEGAGLMSSAGLMRYYDTEDTAIKISPKSVIIISVLSAVLIIALNAWYGLWP